MYFATGAALTAALNALPTSLTGTYKAFDAFYYAGQYMGAYTGTLSPIEHFVQVGAARGYKPNADFDPTFYQARYTDLASLDAADLLYHYVTYGLNEGRPGNATLATYDWASYLTAYPDVAKYVNDNLASFGGSASNGAIAHYVKFGAVQGFTVPGSVAPQSIALTTGLDTGTKFTAGAGNDTFNAIDSSDATVATLTSADSLVGGLGADTLNVAVSGTTTAAASVSTSGIEKLAIVNNSTGVLYTVAADQMSGLTTVTTTAGANPVSITGAASVLNAELVSTNKNLTLASATAVVAGATDASSVTLNAVATTSSVSVTYNGIETFNVVAAGASGSATNSTAVTLASDKLEKVVVTGSTSARLVADLTGADLATQVAVFDASNASGGITATITAGGSGALNVTGGAGNDSFTPGNVTKLMTIVGGAGTDTFVGASGAYDATLTVQAGANVSGFEIAAGSIDQRSYTNNTFTSSTGAGSFTKMGATFATADKVGNGSVTVSRGTDTAADALTINLTATTDGTATITADDEETLTINSAGTTSGVTHTVSLTDGDLTKLVVTGNNALAMGTLTSTAVASIDASLHTGLTFQVDAAASTAALTIKSSAGSPSVAGGTVNTIVGGTKSDSITGGLYADNLTGGLGNDTIVGGGGNDVVLGGNGNDVITAGDGDNDLRGEGGDDSITSGAGNDLIDGGAGNNTIVAGGGDDRIAVTTLSDTANIDGGTGADVLSTTTSKITATSSDGVNSAFITVTGDAAPTIVGVETTYISVDTTGGTSTIPVVLDMTKVTGVTTLNLEQDSDDQTASGFKVNNFAGTAINLYGATTGAFEDKFTTLDGVGQSAVTVTLNDYDAPASALTTVTGITGLTVQSNSTSQFTGSADQQNSLVTLTANAADSVKVISTASAAANVGAGETQTVVISADPVGGGDATLTVLGVAVALTDTNAKATTAAAVVTAVNNKAELQGLVNAVTDGVDTVTLRYNASLGNVSAAADTLSTNFNFTITDNVGAFAAPAASAATLNANAATAVTVTAGAKDGVHIANVSSTGDNVLNLELTAGSAGVLGLGRVNLDASTVLNTLITLADDAILSTNGATSGAAVDLDFTSTATMTVTLGASATAKIDLTGEVVTAGTFALATGSALTLGTGTVGAGTSSYTFTGRGGLSSSAGNNTFALGGTKTTFNTSGLETDTGFTITTASGAINVTTGAGVDNITGGSGNDTISAGDGVDVINGGLGADVLTGGAGADAFTYTTDTASGMATGTVTKLTDVDTVNVLTGDTFDFTSATFTDGGDKNIVLGNAAIQTVTIATTTTETTATLFYAAIQAGITGGGVANSVYIVTFADGGADTTADGTFAGTYLVINDDTAAIAVGDAVIKLVGVTTGSTISEGGDIITLTIA
jgi:hypothetical protein